MNIADFSTSAVQRGMSKMRKNPSGLVFCQFHEPVFDCPQWLKVLEFSII